MPDTRELEELRTATATRGIEHMPYTRNYAVLRNPSHCDECGWKRLRPLTTRKKAIEGAEIMRRLFPQDRYIARKVKP